MPRIECICPKCLQVRPCRTRYRGRPVPVPPCFQCGEDLVRPEHPDYRRVRFQVEAEWVVGWVREARRSYQLYRSVDPETIARIGEQVRKDATALAHEARVLHRELRFEFDTDASGRPLN